MKSKFAFVVLFLTAPLVQPVLADSKEDENEILARYGPVVELVWQETPGAQLTKVQVYNMGFCLGFLWGINGPNNVHRIMKKEDLFCILKEGIVYRQSLTIIVKYLEDHPQELHLQGVFLAISALKNPFPCKGAQ